MSQIQGIGVGRGIATGPVLTMPEPLAEPASIPRTTDADVEKSAAADALEAVAVELDDRGARAGGDAQHVLEAQAMMARDPGLIDDVNQRIDDGSTGERAVFEAFEAFREMLIGLGGYMAERASDLSDVSQRVVAHLRGVAAPGVPESDTPFILVARDLAPADTALLDLEKVLALVTSEGGPTSHTAILARSRSIPAIVGVVDAGELTAGTLVIVDAGAGTITIEPSSSDIESAELRTAELKKIASAPITPGALADGHAVPLMANLGKPSEAADALALGAEGVGLFRTEFLFLDSTSAPTVRQQREAYTALLTAFAGKKVVVRALDAGSDKPLAFLNDSEEENPALGLRGIRALRAKEDILREQLTALAEAQAATTADLWVMAPMVADSAEAEYFVTLAKELGIKVAGVMAEVPSLALMAKEVAAVSDFVSIGTNDLTQYTLAADRLLGSVAHYQDPWHPAVLRLIAMLGEAGRDAGKPVGVCGEAAADPALAVVLVGLGVTSHSMTPAALADVRAELARTTLEQAKARAVAALAAPSAAEARSAAAAVG